MDGNSTPEISRYTPESHLYQHQALEDNNSIRLLDLQSGHFDDNIFIQLFEVSLSEAIEYEALSYSWDSPIQRSPVYCHGKAIMVTENCVAALRQLRHRDRNRFLWVDSLCVDQSSLEERGQQVQLMGDVYTKAKSVIVWLGKANELSDFVMELLIDNAAIEDSRWWPRLMKYCHTTRVLVKWRAKEESQLKRGLDVSDIFGSIYKRSWFTRMWVVQEFVLSRDAYFHIGDRVIEAEKLFRTFDKILNQRLSWGQIAMDNPLQSSMMSYFRTYRGLRDSLRAGDQNATTASAILISGRLQMSTDPRDAVFGTYGILQRLKIPLPLPSYTKTTEEVFTEATKAAMEHDHSLLLLEHTFKSRSELNLPSWVPDWSVEGNPICSTRDFTASKISRSDNFVFLPGDLLSVDGIVIDTIACCTAGEFPSTDNLKEQCSTIIAPERQIAANLLGHEIIPSWIKAASTLKSYPTGEDVREAFGLVLVHDSQSAMNMVGTKASTSFGEGSGFRYWIQAHLLDPVSDEDFFSQAEGSWFISDPKFCIDFAQQLESQSKSTSYANEAERASLCVQLNKDALFFNHYVHVFSSRTVFFTTEGGYMGKGLLGMEQGDTVILVAGVTMPLIARKMGERYRLLGPCYVHGIMYGAKWPSDATELVKIVLE